MYWYPLNKEESPHEYSVIGAVARPVTALFVSYIFIYSTHLHLLTDILGYVFSFFFIAMFYTYIIAGVCFSLLY